MLPRACGHSFCLRLLLGLSLCRSHKHLIRNSFATSNANFSCVVIDYHPSIEQNEIDLVFPGLHKELERIPCWQVSISLAPRQADLTSVLDPEYGHQN
jgi:hypothetical protein